MKKILGSLLLIIACLLLVGCGKSEELDNSEKDEPKTKETSDKKEKNKKEDNKETSEKTIIDDEIIDIDDEENRSPGGETVNVSEVVNCKGCVFAYFNDEGDKAKKLGDTLSSEEYTSDISKLKTTGGKQRHNFFGLVLSGNTISKAYACILKDNKIYCIEGSTNGAYHTNNISILNQVFTASQCRTISDGHTYTCTDGSYNGDTKTNGYTSMHYETSCTIYGSDSNTGKLICH